MRTAAIIAPAALCALLAPALHAQPILSVGAEGVFPTGGFNDQASFGAGPALGAEFALGDRVGLTVQFAFDRLSPVDAAESFESWLMIPAQIGGKVYFEQVREGGHLDIMMGSHNQFVNTTATDDGATLSTLHPSWGVGLGYQVHKFDVSARYNMITDNIEGANWSYVGVRLAYLIYLGKKTP